MRIAPLLFVASCAAYTENPRRLARLVAWGGWRQHDLHRAAL